MEKLKSELLNREKADYTAWRRDIAAYGFTPEETVWLCRMARLPADVLDEMTNYIQTMEELTQ